MPITIKGGREDGYRIFTFKANYDSGEWKIVVETSTGVEISRLYFEVIPVEKDSARSFTVEKKIVQELSAGLDSKKYHLND